ncbi:adenosylcobinamide-phosphate synthase CbiB [Maritalea porphyrae]|uniref:adenosylcobinamide-phosphate synthase CbiB n=1 Tax=Maritalea porphyrae TaxID=880732 RepID=UPI0022AF36D2|nr:adenosylcobinamide-phosphate synthase CbiB [Maritalea porphyrae]MCZ4271760.1 adenosylcobinamide-phosphate synthase CbiB [Maritalea porphyrae]
MTSFVLAFAATLLERILGYPRPVLNAVGHPVMWMGKLIEVLEKRANNPALSNLRRRRNGFVMLTILLATTAFVSLLIVWTLRDIPFGWAAQIFLASTLIAQKELGQAVKAVADGLRENLTQGRHAVSHIVGRDPDQLDEDGVAHAAVESLAENTSDGIIAPIFYLVLFGLPGVALYKAINTADSMVGHKNEQFLDFGFASAKLDDLANFIPARLTAAIFALTARFTPGMDGEAAWRSARRDAKLHRSPNAGWPEAAMAGALNIKLGGARDYDGKTLDLATMGEGKDFIEALDIDRALKLYGLSLTLTLAVLFVLALIFG